MLIVIALLLLVLVVVNVLVLVELRVHDGDTLHKPDEVRVDRAPTRSDQLRQIQAERHVERARARAQRKAEQ